MIKRVVGGGEGGALPPRVHVTHGRDIPARLVRRHGAVPVWEAAGLAPR